MSKVTTKNFALIGAAGFVAPRHLQAIHDTNHRLVAATDPHDAVGVLDQYAFDIRYFPEIERFDRHLEKLRRGPQENRVHWVSICSPNYLHDAHIRLALRVGAHALCEKPLVINPWNLDALEYLEKEHDRRVYTVLQLRTHPELLALRETLASQSTHRHQVDLSYITGRGAWYLMSWKGQEEKSGGVALNIGIHFFDMLLWLFGPLERQEVHVKEKTRMAGYLSLKNADVRWFLSVDPQDLPSNDPNHEPSFRSLVINGKEIDFSRNINNLHTKVYEKTLAGQGFGIAQARPSIELIYQIRNATPVDNPNDPHPLLQRLR